MKIIYFEYEDPIIQEFYQIWTTRKFKSVEELGDWYGCSVKSMKTIEDKGWIFPTKKEIENLMEKLAFNNIEFQRVKVKNGEWITVSIQTKCFSSRDVVEIRKLLEDKYNIKNEKWTYYEGRFELVFKIM